MPLETKFHLLETSWNVLRDPVARRSYDAARSQRDKLQSHPIGERVSLKDMREEEEEEEEEDEEDGLGDNGDYDNGERRTVAWSHPCRCGGEYFLSTDNPLYPYLLKCDAVDDAVSLCCSDCSLAITVTP